MFSVLVEEVAAAGWQERYRGELAEVPGELVQPLGTNAGFLVLWQLQVGQQYECFVVRDSRRAVSQSHPPRTFRVTRLGCSGWAAWPVDFVFHYRPHGLREGYCRVQLFAASQGAVILLTELPGNPGQTVINAAEWIATALTRQYQLDPQQTIWAEHQVDRNQANRPPDPSLDEYYDQMTFQWARGADGWQASDVAWSHHSSAAWLEELLGQPLLQGES